MADSTEMSLIGDYRIESPSSYIPMDRRHALAKGVALPERLQGTALFADISGFTPLTEMLARELGAQRGSEEITRQLNCVYDAILAPLHNFGGSVIGFSGDAVTCWFDGDSGLRATAAALQMQKSMQPFTTVTIPSGKTATLAMKVVCSAGPARRFVVGDPQYWVVDVLAGATLDALALVEKHATGGEVVLDSMTAARLQGSLQIGSWREDMETEQRYAIITGLTKPVEAAPWPPLDEAALDEEVVRPWLLPPVYARLRSGLGEFLAELRPAVALFMNFTGVDYDADAEAGAKLDTFIRRVQDILAHYDGTLIQLTFGDKGSYLYAAFGAPTAHEDDAHRAASAALELRDLAGKLDFIKAAKIGLTQGRMRTGSYGGSMMRTYGVLGDATNLSARLMQAAAPRQIMATREVYQAITDAFIWEPLADIQVKGKSTPIAVYSLVSAGARQSMHRHEAPVELPMVGRERELALIEERLDVAAQGRGQIVGITAEAGMGKSRLVAEVIRLAHERGWRRYGGECSSYGTNTSYHVWYSIWWHFFGLDPSWSLPAQVHALEIQLSEIDPGLVARLPLLGAALNLPIPDNDLTASFDAKLRKSSLEALLIDCLRYRSQEAPILLLLEDCHWLDPLSYDLLDVVAKAIINLPILLLLAYRPPQLHYLKGPRVSALAHYVGVELNDFTADEARQLIELKLSQAYGSVKVPAEMVQRITERAGGNPFYIEELLNYLRDQGINPQDAGALAKLDLPSSLQSLILSRIDQLAESQRITLKIASIVGRLFDAPTLWGYYPQLGSEARIRQDLEALIYADLTQREPSEPDLTYAFRHVLTQEVAYESLPFATRAILHEQLAQFIERNYGHLLDQYLDQLAYHYDQSSNEAKKREYLLKAGRRAQQVYANTAAIDYFRRCLPLLVDAEKPAVLLDLGGVLELVGRWQEARESYLQAWELGRRLDDRRSAALSQAALGDLSRKQGDYAESATWLSEARAGFDTLGDLNGQAGVAQVLQYRGTLLARQGDYEESLRSYQDSLAIRRALGDQFSIANLLNNMAIVARFRQDFETARLLNEEALAIREELGNRWAIGMSLNNLGTLALGQGYLAESRTRMEQALAIWRQVGDRWAIANTLTGLGDVASEEQDYPTARSYYSESLAINRELGDRLALAYLFEALGCLAATQAEPERAVQLVGAAAALRTAIGAPLPPAEVSRLTDRLAPARQQLGEGASTVAEAAGRALSLDEAIELAIG